MNRLSYQTLETQKYDGFLLKEAPERVLQFGNGPFLRSFVEHFVDVLNEKADFNSKIVVVQPYAPTPESIAVREALEAQDGLYTLYLSGQEDGCSTTSHRVISSISRILNVFSDHEEFLACAENPALRFLTFDTAETPISYDPSCQLEDRPAASLSGKLTQFLYARYRLFGREKGKGFVILPCELFEDNGRTLKKCVLTYAAQWNLPRAFTTWLNEENVFCSTLVDRIVTGTPANADVLNAENGWVDQAMTAAEEFGSWVIESQISLTRELPFKRAELPVTLTRNILPYQERKIRILNGSHTAMVLGAYLAGYDVVRDCMNDEVIGAFVSHTLSREILPTLSLPMEELEEFAANVVARFHNTLIDHELLSIAENSTSKWEQRVLPSIKGYVIANMQLPPCLTASLAFYIAFYRQAVEWTEEGQLIAQRKTAAGTNAYVLNDDTAVLDFFYAHRNDDPEQLVHAVCENAALWGTALSLIPGLEKEVTEYLLCTLSDGVKACMKLAMERETEE